MGPESQEEEFGVTGKNISGVLQSETGRVKVSTLANQKT